ncbi:MAG: citrate/2-methylcitrate synthase [Ilumatobacter fluminis]|uniref:citrate/2-methylcitrate synthase n=1 Tax=Ilumatobacter fluminis TaxID=467091 RepID=UPI0032EFBE2D
MIGSAEAARLLGVSKPTLYAYVSRGLVERHTAVDGRTSLYPREQIERLATRGRSKAPVERPSIDVKIGSSITLLDDVTLRYRGHEVAELARTRSFEQVGELLWTGDLPGRPVVWPLDRAQLDRCLDVATPLVGRSAVAAMGAASHALSASSTGSESGGDAARAVAAIAPTLVGGPRRGPVAERLTKAYVRRPSPELVAAVDRALVLLADHELATSTLAVRVACSVRADPFAAIAAGLSVVSGRLHGGASVETADLVARAEVDGAAATVAALLDQGRRLPGFGHSVYRRGDPRVAPLLEAVRSVPGADRTIALVDDMIAEAGRRLAHLPNVDLALGALLHAGGFPADAPLFAVARLAGWGAHYDEEAAERPVRFRGLTQLR